MRSVPQAGIGTSACSERVQDGRWRQPSFREQHERVIEQVRDLAGERLAGRGSLRAGSGGLCVVACGEQDLGRFFGDLAANLVDPTLEERAV